MQTLQSALNTLQNLKTWISHEKLTNPQIHPEIFLLNDKPVLRKQEIDCEHGSLVDGIKVWIWFLYLTASLKTSVLILILLKANIT